MHTFILKRISNIVITLFFLSMFLFILVRLIPGSPEMVILMNRGGGVTSEGLNSIRSTLGLDTSLLQQYIEWIKNLWRLDFGTSYESGIPVMTELFSRTLPTLSLALTSLLISTLSGVTIAFYCALFKQSKWSQFIQNMTILVSSFPTYLVGLCFVLLFSITWSVLPAYGYDSWLHMILPTLTICLPLTAIFIHLFSQIIEEIFDSYYFEAAKSRGMHNKVLYGKTLFLPCLYGFSTIIASNIGTLWGAIIVTETIFSWPGIGSYVMSAIFSRDYPVIIGFTLLMACLTMFIFLIVDILLCWSDPRQN